MAQGSDLERLLNYSGSASMILRSAEVRIPLYLLRGTIAAIAHGGEKRAGVRSFPGEGTLALRVIGSGLGRTGTLSLKLALEQLGFGPCYHMTEVLMEPSRGLSWVRAADGQADWDAIFAGYKSTVDYPGCSFW